MRNYWRLTGLAALVLAAAVSLTACPGPAPSAPVETPEVVTAPAEDGPSSANPAAIAESPEANVEIDIGDVTYGVYANIEILDKNVLPNMNVQRLSSPRFDHRTQLLILDIAPPYPGELPMFMRVGSTRVLRGHTVMIKVHTFREYVNADGEEVVEEILTFDRLLGNQRLVLIPDTVPFNAFDGMTELPQTMLLYSEVEAWLFLHTDVETFDPSTANLDAADYKRYPGFNPARINLVGGGSEE